MSVALAKSSFRVCNSFFTRRLVTYTKHYAVAYSRLFNRFVGTGFHQAAEVADKIMAPAGDD